MLFALHNLGNTCYVNTAIQCLMNVPYFKDLLDSMKRTSKQRNSHEYVNGRIIYTLCQFGKDSSTLNNTSILKDLLIELKKNKSGIKMNFYEQNDASEFILYMLDEIESESVRLITKDDIHVIMGNMELTFQSSSLSKSCSVSKRKVLHTTSPDMKKLECVIRNKILHRFFTKFSDIMLLCTSVLVSQIKCKCTKLHHNYDFSNVIHLDVNQNKTLQDCFADLLKPQYFNTIHNSKTSCEYVEWTCDSCNSKQVSKKTQAFWKFGKVLIIFLNRFEINHSGYPMKNTRAVEIPEAFRVDPYIISSNTYPRSDSTYRLVSVGCHIGVLKGGHYYSLLKNNIHDSNSWSLVDDDVIIRKKEGVKLVDHFKNVCFCVYVSM